MNDATEQALAREHAQRSLARLEQPMKSFGEGMVQYARELLARDWRFEDWTRAYTVSLSSEADSLEQWRAYCPRSGGVALGFPTSHLDGVASDQGFLLAPCVYDESMQIRLVDQILDFHLDVWNRRQPLHEPRQGISSHLVRDFVSDLDRFAPLLKHRSFAAEREWRLISPLSSEMVGEYIHIPAATGIKQFRAFSLLTPAHPLMPHSLSARHLVDEPRAWEVFRAIVGPSTNPGGMREALRNLVPVEFGELLNVEGTESPYK